MAETYDYFHQMRFIFDKDQLGAAPTTVITDLRADIAGLNSQISGLNAQVTNLQNIIDSFNRELNDGISRTSDLFCDEHIMSSLADGVNQAQQFCLSMGYEDMTEFKWTQSCDWDGRWGIYEFTCWKR